MAVKRYLVDKSAWARLHLPAVRDRLMPLLERGVLATCVIVDLEVLYSARNAEDHSRVRSARRGFEWLPMTNEIGDRAIEVQGLLAQSGEHRRTSIADLLIAATAERHSVVVLHYDADYDGIAKVTGQPMEWVVEQGSVP
ncbi:PIN domain nuclease [Streptomyces sp. NPDC053429]|uniref:PIN domain nuclease n=1 Tax=Streptomyces sp. NPDC053429 TaxID=3365702 RepID=UPI0037D2638E